MTKNIVINIMKNINLFGNKSENALDSKKTIKGGFKAIFQKTQRNNPRQLARLLFKIGLSRATAN